MKKVLILAYYFPPLGMGGTQRIAKFVKYLPEFDWKPYVVTVDDIVYFAKDESLLKEVREAHVTRTGSLDPQRLLARFALDKPQPAVARKASGSKLWRAVNKILQWIFIPDSKILWQPFAFFKARQLIRANEIDCILTSGPPHASHLTGLLLKRMLKIPWVADFRDGWSGGNFQTEPTFLHRALNRFYERQVLHHADAVIAVSFGLRDSLLALKIGDDRKYHTITNGFDLKDFSDVNHAPPNEKFTIAYCGAMTDIAPLHGFLNGLAHLLMERPKLREKLSVHLIGIDLEGAVKKKISALSLADVIKFKGYLSHPEALKNLVAADLLLYPVAEWASRDFIPGKTFEYLSSGRPVLAIGPQVEGVKILAEHGTVEVIPHTDDDKIKQAILKFYSQKPKQDGLNFVDQFERKTLTKKLANILNRIV